MLYFKLKSVQLAILSSYDNEILINMELDWDTNFISCFCGQWVFKNRTYFFKKNLGK